MWGGLGLEARDGAVLGPRPIRVRTIAGAKLTALLALGAAFALGFTSTSALYSVLMIDRLHPPSRVFFWVIGAQALSMVSASAFSFLSVLAVWNALRALLSDRWFERFSSVVQAAMIVVVLSALLLLPLVRADVSRDWMRDGAPPIARALPPLWFLGIETTIEGRVLADLPVYTPQHIELPTWMRLVNDRDVKAYHTYSATFAELASTAGSALTIAALVALLGFAWNSRSLRLPVVWLVHRSRARQAITRWMLRTIAPLPAQRAGFAFTLAVLTRSAPHRLVMSAGLAFGLSAALVLAQSGWSPGEVMASGALPSAGVLAAPLAIVVSLIGGFRQAVRLPAELPAAWATRMSWPSDWRPFLAGCRRTATVALILAPLIILLPLSAFVLGVPLALAHALTTGLVAQALLDALFLEVPTVPFASPYVPLQNPKLIWPASILALLLVPFCFGAVARVALTTRGGMLVFVTVNGAICASLIVARRRKEGRSAELQFEPPPSAPTQRLGLRERMMG
jgi:hypothetical protein